MSRKKRVLFVGEASFLATGFATYWHEVIKRIYDTGEFEIAELGAYGRDGDARIKSVPWQIYTVAPGEGDEEGHEAYKSNPINQFGAWRFDDVCLHFKPDIVLSIRDYWMDEFIDKSVFRKYFIWYWMLTIDGIPQRDLWLDIYRRCDGCLTYSQWAWDIMKKDAFKGTNMITVASPGSDLNVFKPPDDKGAHKLKLSIDPGTIIIGTVMRNQKRKLYYDLVEAFSKWVYKAKTKGHIDLVKKTFLYLHTSYPDVGYDIGRAIIEFKVGTKVLMTYVCNNCGTVYPSFFQGEWAVCRRCRQKAAHPPNADSSPSREVLAEIMRLFDLYVQYSVSEGYGMPCNDAMACGTPIAAVRYSAMEDHLVCPTSIPIEVGRYFYESITETEQRRALPNNDDFVQKLDKFVRFSAEKRKEMSKETVKYATELVDVYGQKEKLPRFSWDRTAAIWVNVLNQCEIKDPNLTWLNPIAQIETTEITKPDNFDKFDSVEFVNWVMVSIFHRPEMVNTAFSAEWVKHLNAGFRIVGSQKIATNRQSLVDHFLEILSHRNQSEEKRVAMINVDKSKLKFEVF
jgi:glycosyltransferase involved in cell wall biosynthesis